MAERYCTVTYDWVTDFTVIQVHINSHGSTVEEAVKHAAQVLRETFGNQIVIDCDDLLDTDNIEADMRRNKIEVIWSEETGD